MTPWFHRWTITHELHENGSGDADGRGHPSGKGSGAGDEYTAGEPDGYGHGRGACLAFGEVSGFGWGSPPSDKPNGYGRGDGYGRGMGDDTGFGETDMDWFHLIYGVGVKPYTGQELP